MMGNFRSRWTEQAGFIGSYESDLRCSVSVCVVRITQKSTPELLHICHCKLISVPELLRLWKSMDPNLTEAMLMMFRIVISCRASCNNNMLKTA